MTLAMIALKHGTTMSFPSNNIFSLTTIPFQSFRNDVYCRSERVHIGREKVSSL